MHRRDLKILIIFMIMLVVLPGKACYAAQHLLITDTNNHRVIEVDREKKITWQYGTIDVSQNIWNHVIAGINGVARNYLNYPRFAARLKSGNTLIVDGENRRVIEVSSKNETIWSFKSIDMDGLFYPIKAERLKSGSTLIADWAGHRVIEVNQDKDIIWQYGKAGISGAGFDELNQPSDCSRLDNGNTLIVDTGNERVIEVNTKNEIVWEFGVVGVPWVGGTYLNNPLNATRLGSGITLIVDEGNSRVIEVSNSGEIIWQYGGSKGNSPGQLNSPYQAFRTKNEDTIIADHGNHRIVEVNTDGKIVWEYGDSYRRGINENELSYPSSVQAVDFEINNPEIENKLAVLSRFSDRRDPRWFFWVIGAWALFCFTLVFGMYYIVGKWNHDE